MPKPTITAIMPHYNYGQFFPEAFDSLLTQTLKPDHICICDDQSTDGSFEKVRDHILNTKGFVHWASKFKVQDHYTYECSGAINGIKITLLRNKQNGGRSDAMNSCLKETIENTDIYAILDCDDIYHPDKIKKSVNVMISNRSIGVVYTDLLVWNMAKNEKKIDYYRSFDYDLLCARNCCNNNSIVAAEAFKRVGFYDKELTVAEDYDMWLRIAEIAPFYHIPEALFTYRISGLNESLTTKQEVWQRCLTRLHTKRIERNR